MFTWRHLMWLVICTGLIYAAVYVYRKKRPELNSVLTVALIIAVISESVKMAGVIELVPSQNGELLLPYLPLNHLPLHFCSIQIILIAVARFMKNEKRRETLLAFMTPTCILGGIMALLMPSIFTTTISVEKAFTSAVSYQFFYDYRTWDDYSVFKQNRLEHEAFQRYDSDSISVGICFDIPELYICKPDI